MREKIRPSFGYFAPIEYAEEKKKRAPLTPSLFTKHNNSFNNSRKSCAELIRNPL